MDIIASANKINVLGKVGENRYTRVLFDISEYYQTYPGATVVLWNQLPGGTDSYPVADAVADDGTLYWTVTSGDLSKEGIGQCEIVVTVDEVIAKSVKYVTSILPSLDGGGTPPEPWESWRTEFQGYVTDAQAAAETAKMYGSKVSVMDGNLIFDNGNEGD